MHLPSEQAAKEIVRSAAQVGLEVDQAHGVLKEFKAALKKKVRVSERASNFLVNFTMPDPDAYEADDPPCAQQRGNPFAFGGSMSSGSHGNQQMPPQMAHMAQMFFQNMAFCMGGQQDVPITFNPRRKSLVHRRKMIPNRWRKPHQRAPLPRAKCLLSWRPNRRRWLLANLQWSLRANLPWRFEASLR